MDYYENAYFKDYTNLMCQIKIGQKLVGKPKIKVSSVFPPGWDPNSISSFAEAAKAWRQHGK